MVGRPFDDRCFARAADSLQARTQHADPGVLEHLEHRPVGRDGHRDTRALADHLEAFEGLPTWARRPGLSSESLDSGNTGLPQYSDAADPDTCFRRGFRSTRSRKWPTSWMSIKDGCSTAKSFVEYGLFVQSLSHLIAGPIQRPGHLLPQVQRERTFDADRVFDGIMLIFSGLIRKLWVADNCAVLANAAFGGQFGKPTLWVVLLGTYAFAWQVYGDFSGYSDIARGQRPVDGLPFHGQLPATVPFSTSAGILAPLAHQLEFLVTRLYLHSAGRQRGRGVENFQELDCHDDSSRLWPGANWTFVIFGAIHGVVLSLERLVFPVAKGAADAVQSRGFTQFLSIWGTAHSHVQRVLPEPGLLSRHVAHGSYAILGEDFLILLGGASTEPLS